jgi:hypothetical protein
MFCRLLAVIVVVILWWLDSRLLIPVQSMPITTKVVSSNPIHGCVIWYLKCNATFNEISVISWLSIVFPDLVEETRVLGHVLQTNCFVFQGNICHALNHRQAWLAVVTSVK